MCSVLFRQPNAQYELYVNIRGVSPACFWENEMPILKKKNWQWLAFVYKILPCSSSTVDVVKYKKPNRYISLKTCG